MQYLGTYDTEEAAGRAYDLASIACRKQNAIVNFPIIDYLDIQTGKLKPDLPWSLPPSLVSALLHPTLENGGAPQPPRKSTSNQSAGRLKANAKVSAAAKAAAFGTAKVVHREVAETILETAASGSVDDALLRFQSGDVPCDRESRRQDVSQDVTEEPATLAKVKVQPVIDFIAA